MIPHQRYFNLCVAIRALDGGQEARGSCCCSHPPLCLLPRSWSSTQVAERLTNSMQPSEQVPRRRVWFSLSRTRTRTVCGTAFWLRTIGCENSGVGVPRATSGECRVTESNVDTRTGVALLCAKGKLLSFVDSGWGNEIEAKGPDPWPDKSKGMIVRR